MIQTQERTAWTPYGWLPELDSSCHDDYDADATPLTVERVTGADRVRILFLQTGCILRQAWRALVDFMESDRQATIKAIRARGPSVQNGVFRVEGLPPEARQTYELMTPEAQKRLRLRIGARE